METLHSGIVLPSKWPPRDRDLASLAPATIPYLIQKPGVINIDIGRQLFIDDFLIADTTLARVWHAASYVPDNPVLSPQTPMEVNEGTAPVAAPFSDGCWYDPADGLYRLYYHAGWWDGTALAISEDAIHWQRKMLDVVPGTNRILQKRSDWHRDGSTIWLDQQTHDPAVRYKLFEFFRTPQGHRADVYASHDGLHFTHIGQTGKCGDNSSFFYDPFRKKWVFSIRKVLRLDKNRTFRTRYYYECTDFATQHAWQDADPVPWLACDRNDLCAVEADTEYNAFLPPQLYHFNAVGYESLMLGLCGILKDYDEADNAVVDASGIPKHLDLHLAFSRDGFHYSRAGRSPFIACSNMENTWNRGYLHASSGLCFVSEDHLTFPVGGFSGISPRLGTFAYAGGSTGLAMLRRDGFASMKAFFTPQRLTTEPVVWAEGTCLFVNAQAAQGFVGAEVLDHEGNTVEGFSLADCRPAVSDSTRQPIRFRGGALTRFQHIPVRIRFHVQNASLFSFWVSADERGSSGGWLAAGGAGYAGDRDL